jgi:exoribonuclease II
LLVLALDCNQARAKFPTTTVIVFAQEDGREGFILTRTVKTNTAMDRDARKRATSVYLVQRAVPMLPPALCEELCTLKPGVERLTFSAKFVMDKEGNVLEKSFARSIIK